jgi:hypothetical protein
MSSSNRRSPLNQSDEILIRYRELKKEIDVLKLQFWEHYQRMLKAGELEYFGDVLFGPNVIGTRYVRIRIKETNIYISS